MPKAGGVASFLGSVLPSFFTSGQAQRKAQNGSQSLSYINGVRGCAAAIVVIFHTSLAYSSTIVFWGYGLESKNYNLLQLPIIRIIYSGHAMVAIFFVVGGYVNALKPISLLHAQDFETLGRNLSSSLLRRIVRLCLPVIISTFGIALTLRLGLWEPSRRNLTVIRFPDGFPPLQDSFIGELRHWYSEMERLFNLFAGSYFTEYDVHTWTIPAELRASMVLTLVLLMLSRCTVRARLVFMVLLAGYTLTCGMWEIVLYIMGACLAELDAVRASRAVSEKFNSSMTLPTRVAASSSDLDATLRRPSQDAEPAAKSITWRRVRLAVILFASLFLMSAPSDRLTTTPGYRFICTLVPASLAKIPFRFVNGTGAIMFIYALSNSKTLQKPFNSAIAQYLGSISFSLYIVHGPVMHIVSYVIVPALWRINGTDTAFKYNFSVFCGNAITYMIMIWVAELFSNHVDKNCVKLSRWVENAVTI